MILSAAGAPRKAGRTKSPRRGRARTSPDAGAEGLREIRLSNRITIVAIDRLKPATINDRIYKPVDPNDPDIVETGRDIKSRGLLVPIVASVDDVIVSGHRRRVACQLAGLTKVPVQRSSIHSSDPRFPEYVIAFNRQRVKTTPEIIREEVIRTSPDDAHNELLAHRRVESARAYRRVEESGLRVIAANGYRSRAAITDAKRPMLDAAVGIFERYHDYWPLTLRQVHYRMLTLAVLRNATNPASTYVNSLQSYKDLSDLLTRARLTGEVPWEAMHDPTRPHTRWVGYDSVGPYIRRELDRFLCGYKRNLLQSQDAYVELVVEKITAQDIAERAAAHYHVPVGVGRGYSSVTLLDETADRFHASGKERFVLLVAGDLDPEGENIAQVWARCLEDEHDINDLTVVKVGVNPDQVAQYNLAPLPVKKSSRTAGYVAAHGTGVYELEAFEPDVLQRIIRDAIRGVLDLGRFAEEQRRESEDARHLMAYRRKVQELLAGCEPDYADESTGGHS